ncbi:MAG: hypothetical protein AMJ93_03090 [Anaerolineae bacterium SM23_84]|nr:MAG: hypothetical protein AMJ93_03090 [Anaerolineae bacterium SM23_84]
MLRKVVLGTVLVGVMGILVTGAIIRTAEKTGSVAEAQGLGRGRSEHEAAGYSAVGAGQRQGAYGQGARAAERQYPNYEGAPEDWVVYEGAVVQAPAAGMDMVIETSDGEELVVGTGPGYMEDQGFTLQVGEQVQVQGYWEGDEFKAAQVMRLRDGQSVTLRDQAGRPAWAGAGRRGGGARTELRTVTS